MKASELENNKQNLVNKIYGDVEEREDYIDYLECFFYTQMKIDNLHIEEDNNG